MRVLITNNTLAGRAGSELYVRDLALALLRRGHTPLAYSTNLGEVARELIAATVPVVDDLGALGAPPDIIHGHHHLDLMTALLHFDRTPAICFCHGWIPWEEAPPPRSPRILRYIAVDDTCRDRLVFQHGIPESSVDVLLNFVDLARFKPRPALPERPAKALIFSNYFNDQGDATIIREACDLLGITLDVMGGGSGHSCEAPESRLGAYDLVFAKGRAALEALATGNAVIVCDRAGLGGMVTVDGLAGQRRLNFGIRQLRQRIDFDNVTREIQRYAAPDAAEVSARIRAEASLDGAVDRLISIYEETIAAAALQSAPDRGAEARAASRYLRWLSPVLKGRYDAEARAAQAHQQAEDLRVLGRRATEDHVALEETRAAQSRQIDTLEETRAAQSRQIDTLEETRVAQSRTIDALEEMRVAQSRTIDALEQTLAAQSRQIDTLNECVADRAAVQMQAVALAHEVATLSNQAADRQSLKERADAQALEIEGLLQTQRSVARSMETLIDERDNYRRQLDQVLASRAWRWLMRYGRIKERWVVHPLGRLSRWRSRVWSALSAR